jgi:ribose-phosphate pyrophosphokinase
VPDGEPHYQLAFCQYDNDGDIIELAMWADAMKRKRKKTLLVIPYLPGARMDRGAPLGAGVYANMINLMGIDDVVCLDPHSDVAPALYDRLTVYPLANLPIWASLHDSWGGVIVPDPGARKRAESVAGCLGVPVFQAQKHRDWATGQLSGFSCEKLSEGERYLIVDDICDGGGTFLGLADYLFKHQLIIPSQLDLWVTHGIFSQGLDELVKRFDFIFTTDSRPGVDRHIGDNATVYPILSTLVRAITEGIY